MEIKMIPMFTKLLTISSEAIKALGFFSNVTILLYEGCWRVLSILISFNVNEKNAISDPEKRKDKTKSTNNIKKSMVVVDAGVMAIIISN